MAGPGKKRARQNHNVTTPMQESHNVTMPMQELDSVPSQPSGHSSPPNFPGSNEASCLTRSARRRGQALGLAVLKAMRAGHQMTVKFTGNAYRPTEGDATNFTTEASKLMKQVAPADITKWKEFPEDVLEEIYSRLWEGFKVDVSDPHTKIAVNNMIQFNYRQWRCRNKKHYTKLVAEEKNPRTNPLKKVKLSEWERMCDRYENEDYQALCKKNSDNRKKVKVNHISGSKPFVRLCHELKKIGLNSIRNLITYSLRGAIQAIG